MKRRTVLTTASLVPSVVVAGCLSSRDAIGSSAGIPAEIVDWEATTPSERDELPARDDPPRIESEEGSTVVVEGYLLYPSGNCDELVISPERTEYDPSDGSLYVWVGYVREQDAGEDCTIVESSTGYRVRIRFDEGLPDRVTAVEYGSYGEKETTKP